MKLGKDLLKTVRGHKQRDCPHCGKQVTASALVKLVYTFEKCNCSAVEYPHLVETVWHRTCWPKVQKKISGRRSINGGEPR